MIYFKIEEFKCKCGCDAIRISPFLLEKIDIARGKAGIPFKVTSGYRCKNHNRAVGGASDSQHVKGTAVDIACSNSADRAIIIKALLDSGFTGIGIAKHFVHGDIRDAKPLCWLY
jgi:zinc D-Ala-D-Ala carboxypeptidase